MKKFMSMLLMAAVVVTSTVVPNLNKVESVKAASVTSSAYDLSVNGQKYDCYEDFIEAICIALEYKKVDLDAYTNHSYRNENNEEVYYTYKQWIAKWGNYAIPDDCVSALYDGVDVYLAYKADGTKVIIYDKEGRDKAGYDIWGYDKDGYGRDGYNKEGYNRLGYGREGYNKEGYDRSGYGRDGYNKEGYNKEGYNRDGYNKEGYDKEGYNRDGYSKEGYNKEGYSQEGYDRSGYDKEGYDKEGYNREGHLKQGKNVSIKRIAFTYTRTGHPYNLLWKKNKKKQWNVKGVYTADGKKLDPIHYEITKTPLHVDKYGHGIYKVKVQTDKCYNNVSFEKKVTVVPVKGPDMNIFGYLNGDSCYFIPEKEIKNEEGIKYIQIKFGTLKKSKRKKDGKVYYVFKEGDFTKDCVQKNVDLSKQKLTKFSNPYWSAKGYLVFKGAHKNRQDEIYEMKYRYYVIVNGKKIYTQWHERHTIPTGIDYDFKQKDITIYL